MKPLKTWISDWISEHIDIFSPNIKQEMLEKAWLYFKIEGFGDEPEVYLHATNEGLEFGFESVQWDGYMPSPYPAFNKRRFISWETLLIQDNEEKQKILIDLMLKTANSRKGQYRKCQFCGERVAIEHRFDDNTCHGCASKYLGVVY